MLNILLITARKRNADPRKRKQCLAAIDCLGAKFYCSRANNKAGRCGLRAEWMLWVSLKVARQP